MDILVQYFGNLRQVTNKEKETMQLDENATVQSLLDELIKQYGQAYQTAMDTIKGLRILVDGRDISTLNGMSSALKNGCTVVFLPPIAGG
ncbi:MoaD/ThiS family protein [Coprothermobacter platensis]|jgi:MoaD family protein|uniref:MoaD/ThiS family protein n=1 Tax=Coprothermobacter platensis TaxID=108819 RepID=UPI0003730DF3|nr:MoaD/ThiS family protein [Coprothermobacter platensis]